MSEKANTYPPNVAFVFQMGECFWCPSRTGWGQAAQAGGTDMSHHTEYNQMLLMGYVMLAHCGSIVQRNISDAYSK